MKRFVLLLSTLAILLPGGSLYAQKAPLPPVMASPLLQPSLAPPSAATPAGEDIVTITSLRGQRSGIIIGDATHPPMVCVRFGHGVASPRDAQTGLPTGKRQHQAIQCMFKSFSPAITRLYTLLTTNENITALQLSLNKAATGLIKLTNANIAGIEVLGDAAGLFFTVSLTYQKIEWSSTPTGVVAGDDWEAKTN
jgi:type VI secretion system secreted protein Hcp